MARLITIKKTRPEEDLESMLRRFKKAVLRENILYECKKRESFMNNAEKRREKSKRARILSNSKNKRRI